MLKSTLKDNIRTNKELGDIVEKNMLFINENCKREEKNNFNEKINTILKEKNQNWINDLKKIVMSEEFQKQKERKSNLIVLNNLVMLDSDIKNGNSMLYSISSLDEMWEIYENTIFYLRRMEFDFEDKDCIGFLEFIEEWKLSVEYLIMVISEGDIYNKQKAGYRLCNILMKKQYIDYVEKIASQFKLNIKIQY